MISQISPSIKFSFQKSFIRKCHQILCEGYIEAQKKNYSPDWDEDNFSALLVEHMRMLDFTKSQAISINPQSPIYSKAILEGTTKAKRASVIDMKFSTWSKKVEFIYFMEAKNLSEEDWKKRDGKKIVAKHYQNRYITTGVDNFLKGKYSNGCLVGYVVQGGAEKIIEKINNIMLCSKPSREREILCRMSSNQLISKYQSILPKKDTAVVLDHILLSFN
jgi:hypothetical protein